MDRVQVTIYTDQKMVEEKLEEARKVYAERDARLAGLTDESVDVFIPAPSASPLHPTSSAW